MYNELRETGEAALKRLDLYENMKGINELSNEEINNIESKLFSALDKLKLEKARRIFKDEINSLKIKLGMRQSSRSKSSLDKHQNVPKQQILDSQENYQPIQTTMRIDEQNESKTNEIDSNYVVNNNNLELRTDENQVELRSDKDQVEVRTYKDYLELRNALQNDFQADERVISENVQQNGSVQERHEHLDQQRQLLNQIFYKNINQFNSPTKMSQFDNLILNKSIIQDKKDASDKNFLSEQNLQYDRSPIRNTNGRINYECKSVSPLSKTPIRSRKNLLSTQKKKRNSQQKYTSTEVSQLHNKRISFHSTTPKLKKQQQNISSSAFSSHKINQTSQSIQMNRPLSAMDQQYLDSSHQESDQSLLSSQSSQKKNISNTQLKYQQYKTTKNRSKQNITSQSLHNNSLSFTFDKNQILMAGEDNPFRRRDQPFRGGDQRFGEGEQHFRGGDQEFQGDEFFRGGDQSFQGRDQPFILNSFSSTQQSQMKTLQPFRNNSFDTSEGTLTQQTKQKSMNSNYSSLQNSQYISNYSSNQDQFFNHNNASFSVPASNCSKFPNSPSWQIDHEYENDQMMNNSMKENPLEVSSKHNSHILGLTQNLNIINERILLNKSLDYSPHQSNKQLRNSQFNVQNEIKEEKELLESNSQLFAKQQLSIKTQLSSLVNPLKAKMKECKQNLFQGRGQEGMNLKNTRNDNTLTQYSVQDISSQNLMIKPHKISINPTKK